MTTFTYEPNNSAMNRCRMNIGGHCRDGGPSVVLRNDAGNPVCIGCAAVQVRRGDATFDVTTVTDDAPEQLRALYDAQAERGAAILNVLVAALSSDPDARKQLVRALDGKRPKGGAWDRLWLT